METYLRNCDDTEGILSCLAEWGACGVTDILSEEKCLEIIRTSVVPLATKSSETDHTNVDAQDMATQNMNAYGTIGKGDLFTKELFELRTNEKILSTFCNVYGCNIDNLFMTQGRTAWMRPTILNEGFRTPYHWPEVHIDLNPKRFDNDTKAFFGVFNLLENEEQDGGFHFIPQSHLNLEAWRDKYIDELPDENRYIFNSSQQRDMDEILHVCDGPSRIACPAGTLILFDVRTVHGAQPNYSNKSRMIAFIRAFERDSLEHLNITGSGNSKNISREWSQWMQNSNVPSFML
jgi:hypothetical protein